MIRPLTRRGELADIEAQLTDDRDRDEHRAAAAHDAADYMRIGDRLYDIDDVPDAADVADLRGN